MPRHAFDAYETPPHYVQALLDRLPDLRGSSVYEPCVGKGHIARFLRHAKEVITNDLDPSCRADSHFDASDYSGEAWGREFEWVITNPPFNKELEILEAALGWGKNVAFLSRLSFLEPTLSRSDFWARNQPSDVIVLPRYSFRLNDDGKKATDNMTCAWLIFEQGEDPCLQFIPHPRFVSQASNRAPKNTNGSAQPSQKEPSTRSALQQLSVSYSMRSASRSSKRFASARATEI